MIRNICKFIFLERKSIAFMDVSLRQNNKTKAFLKPSLPYFSLYNLQIHLVLCIQQETTMARALNIRTKDNGKVPVSCQAWLYL